MLAFVTAAAISWLVLRDGDPNASQPLIGAHDARSGSDGLQASAPLVTDDPPPPLGVPAQDRPVLGYGSVGADVATLQRILADLGFDPGPADGQFGPATAAAVTAFQDSRGITPDGVVGPETWSALDQLP